MCRVELLNIGSTPFLQQFDDPLAELQGVAYIGITPIIGSYAQCAAVLDHIGTVPGTQGIMLIFPECLAGLQEFGERVLPLMRTAKLASPRAQRVPAYA